MRAMPMTGGAASFLGMWMMMMVPMMLPSLVPVLWRSRLGLRHAVVAGVAYYVVWGAVGVVAYPVGVVVVPHLPAGVVIVLAGAYQLSRWKTHHLERCRHVPPSPDARAAWWHGVRLGLHCNGSSLGYTMILMVTGLMDVRAMVLVAALTAAERNLRRGAPRCAWPSWPPRAHAPRVSP